MKILVADTVGGDRFSEAYKAYFPMATLRGIEMRDDGDCHPHGYMCGYYAGVLTRLLSSISEIVFARIFDGQGRPVPHSNEWLLEVIERESPDIISNSWGAWDGDERLTDAMGAYGWTNWAREYAGIIRLVNAVSFHAAGNNDVNDSDADVDYPQRLMPSAVNIIGSHNRAGIPSVFSGDGHGVICSMWGERVPLLDGDGNWTLGSGTSFACPKAAGLAVWLGLNHTTFRESCISHATRPIDWDGELPNVKWGWGSLEYRYQEGLAMLPDHLLPPAMSGHKLQFHDLERVPESVT